MDKVFILHYNGFTSWGTPYRERTAWHEVENARAELARLCPDGKWKVIDANRREFADGSVAYIEPLDYSDGKEGL